MNKSFIVKMLRAKKMEYEAIKELMPEPMKEVVEKNEHETKTLIREIATAYLKEEQASHKETSTKEEEKKSKKVEVEF